MAESAEQTHKKFGPDVLEWTLAWQADAAGAKANVAMEPEIFNLIKEGGYAAYMAITDPGATAPAANYDLAINDSYGLDIFGGELGDRHTSASEAAVPLIGPAYASRPIVGTSLTVTFANTTNNNCNGTIVVVFTRFRI